ncbi:hypothetical protein ACFQZ4_21565 [Catellatospora coxensis]
MGDAAFVSAAARDPADPEPVADTKATAAFGLGLLAAVTGLAVGGIVPATIALVLARQAREELHAGRAGAPAPAASAGRNACPGSPWPWPP